MSDQATELDMKLSKHATEIVAAYVLNNHVSLSELPGLIEGVRGALAHLPSGVPAPAEPAVGKATPSHIAKSITPDALISFIDGMPYKALRRHLTARGLDPSSYRALYGLPADYPMTAPSYSARRKEISRRNHFGRHKRS